MLGTAVFTPGLCEQQVLQWIQTCLNLFSTTSPCPAKGECYVNVGVGTRQSLVFSFAVEKSNKPAYSITMLLKNHMSLSKPSVSKRDGNCLVASKAHHGLVQQAGLITAPACPHGQ